MVRVGVVMGYREKEIIDIIKYRTPSLFNVQFVCFLKKVL